MQNTETSVIQSRIKRNEWFQGAFPDLAINGSHSFRGLEFYPHDSEFCFFSEIHQCTSEFAVFAVDGYGQIELRKFGFVILKLQGKEFRLHLYCAMNDENPETVIAPFKDLTNGKTTYGGGRNLDVPVNDGKALVDFNAAVNLECAYSSSSVCALPLSENWLPVAIEAGEKVFRAYE